jgi:hypothetical protein
VTMAIPPPSKAIGQASSRVQVSAGCRLCQLQRFLLRGVAASRHFQCNRTCDGV